MPSTRRRGSNDQESKASNAEDNEQGHTSDEFMTPETGDASALENTGDPPPNNDSAEPIPSAEELLRATETARGTAAGSGDTAEIETNTETKNQADPDDPADPLITISKESRETTQAGGNETADSRVQGPGTADRSYSSSNRAPLPHVMAGGGVPPETTDRSYSSSNRAPLPHVMAGGSVPPETTDRSYSGSNRAPPPHVMAGGGVPPETADRSYSGSNRAPLPHVMAGGGGLPKIAEESAIHVVRAPVEPTSSGMTTPLRPTKDEPGPSRPAPSVHQTNYSYDSGDHYNDQGGNGWDGWKDSWWSYEKKKGPRDINYAYYQVSRQYYLLGEQWTGDADGIPLSEFRFKVQTSPDYVWSDYCTKYFTVRHNVTPAIQRLLDTYECDRGLNDVDRHGNEAYDTTGTYWKMRLDTLWEFMDEIYSGTDADTLETKRSQMWLHKGVKSLQFWSDFETTAREVARSRGCSSAKLTDSEMKCRLHASLPAKCQTFLNERGYKLPGAQGMSYQEVVQAAKAWAQVHWDPHCNAKDVCGVTCETTEDPDYQVNAVALNPGAPTRTTSSHSTTKPSDRPNKGSASATASRQMRE